MKAVSEEEFNLTLDELFKMSTRGLAYELGDACYVLTPNGEKYFQKFLETDLQYLLRDAEDVRVDPLEGCSCGFCGESLDAQ